jgi:hypothetical protein
MITGCGVSACGLSFDSTTPLFPIGIPLLEKRDIGCHVSGIGLQWNTPLFRVSNSIVKK